MALSKKDYTEKTVTSDYMTEANLIGFQRFAFNRSFQRLPAGVDDVMDTDCEPDKEVLVGRGLRFTLGMDRFWIEVYYLDGEHEFRKRGHYFKALEGFGLTFPLLLGVRLDVQLWWEDLTKKLGDTWTRYLFS